MDSLEHHKAGSSFDPEHAATRASSRSLLSGFFETIVKSFVYIFAIVAIIILLIKFKSNFFSNTEETTHVSKSINERVKELNEATALELDFIKEIDQHKFYEKRIEELENHHRECKEKIKELENSKPVEPPEDVYNIPKSRRRVMPEPPPEVIEAPTKFVVDVDVHESQPPSDDEE